MAHQDDAGLLSVKFWSRWCVGSCGAPFGERQCGQPPRRQLRKRSTNRWNHARRGWFASLLRGICGLVCRRQLRNCHVECANAPAVVLPGQPRSGYAECQNHACRGAGRCAGFSLGRARGGCRGTGGDSGTATPRARVPPGVVLRRRQLRCGHAMCGSRACRGAWMRAATLSGAAGRIHSPGACSRVATICENRRLAPPWPGSVLSGSLGSLTGRPPSAWSHAPALPRLVRQSAVRNATLHSDLLREASLQRGPRPAACPVSSEAR